MSFPTGRGAEPWDLSSHSSPSPIPPAAGNSIRPCRWSWTIDQHTLSGVGVGDPLDRLSFLGPGKPDCGALAFKSLGLAVSHRDGMIHELVVYFGHHQEAEYGSFAGTAHLQGNQIALSSATSESSLRDQLGSPYWRGQDEQEVLLFYEHGQREWQIELATDGRLKCWVICEPLLACADQRQAYGVTKSWPPLAQS